MDSPVALFVSPPQALLVGDSGAGIPIFLETLWHRLWPGPEEDMKTRSNSSRRKVSTPIGSWIAALLALAPLSALVWAVQSTGIGIA